MALLMRVLTWIGTIAVVFTVLGVVLIPAATVTYYKASMSASGKQVAKLWDAATS